MPPVTCASYGLTLRDGQTDRQMHTGSGPRPINVLIGVFALLTHSPALAATAASTDTWAPVT